MANVRETEMEYYLCFVSQKLIDIATLKCSIRLLDLTYGFNIQTNMKNGVYIIRCVCLDDYGIIQKFVKGDCIVEKNGGDPEYIPPKDIDDIIENAESKEDQFNDDDGVNKWGNIKYRWGDNNHNKNHGD